MADFIDKLIAFLFAQDKKKHPISPDQEKQLTALWQEEKEEG